MGNALSEVVRMHAQLRGDTTELFQALDQGGTSDLGTAFRRFQRNVTDHLGADVAAGYRLLLRSHSSAIRHVAARILEEQETFARDFDYFALRWHDASEATLRSPAFRDDLETIVSDLMKRIRAEVRLLAMLASVA
jgi:hypothetical protein